MTPPTEAPAPATPGPGPARAPRAPLTPLSRSEFVALMAMLMAVVAFSIDAMLPALPRIAADLTPDAPNRAPLIISAFVLGLGLGTVIVGPLSDAFGRKPVILGGVAVYALGAGLAWQAQSLEWLLAARVLQGFGGAAPRVVALAIIRDLYSGRAMAQMVSFVIIVFTLVPAIAPTFGAGVIALSGSWRGIFPAFVVFALIAAVWLMLRQPETLRPEHRRPPRFTPLVDATAEILRHPVVRGAITVQVLAFGILFACLSSVQLVFDTTFGRADTFHLWFGLIAVVGAGGGFLNAWLVMRMGMRQVIRGTLVAQIAGSTMFLAGTAAGLWSGEVYFAIFLIWTAGVFATAGLTLGNINALALEPMGHIAGTAASVVSAVGTIGAALLAAPVALAFDGTPLPMVGVILAYAVLAWWKMLRLPKDRPGPF